MKTSGKSFRLLLQCNYIFTRMGLACPTIEREGLGDACNEAYEGAVSTGKGFCKIWSIHISGQCHSCTETDVAQVNNFQYFL